MSETVAGLRKKLLGGDGIVAPSKVSYSIEVDESDPRKTLAMRMVEAAFGQPIEELLSADQKGVDVAKKLHVTRSCITRWRKRLGIVVQ